MTSKVGQHVLPDLDRCATAAAKECTWFAKISLETLHSGIRRVLPDL